MRQIQVTRKAIKDLQRLQSTGALKVPEKLFEQLAMTQEGEKFPHTIHLSGYSRLWRSRIDLGGGSSLRLIWTDSLENGSIKFLYIDQRHDDTYDLDLNQLPQEPAYQWNGETGVEWSLFLNGAYKASPVLTQHQRATGNQVGKESSYAAYGEDRRIGFFAHITQSPPGTGKTITAALRACELYEAGWNVTFLLPKRLLEDIQSFRCIQSVPSGLAQGFFCGTFQDWVTQFFPEVANLILSPQDELIILQKLADHAERSRSNLKFNKIDLRDVLLFQSFILKSDLNYLKNSIYRDNEDRIKELKHIKVTWWQQEFSKLGKQCRSEIAEFLCERWECDTTNLPIPSKVGNVLIVDESQDYLLSELKAFKTLCKRWHQAGYPTHLWLLGDLNQRIMPVDFDWGALELVRSEDPGWKCFRNSRQVLKFSNLFLAPVLEKSHKYATRFPYQPADPDKSYETGERVKLISYPSQDAAESFLERLSQSLGAKTRETEKNRSLMYKLASRVKILQSELYRSKYSDRLEFLNVHEAKGREFDSCIVFNVFNFAGTEPTSEDWWQWYTLLTRTRSRLLVIVTDNQKELLKKYVPNALSECEYIHFQDSKSVELATKWIQAEINDLEFSIQEKDIVERYLCDALKLEKPSIYWDTYEVLDRVGIRDTERTDLERRLLSLLQQYDHDVLRTEFELSKLETKDTLIHCLIMRAMEQYWAAVDSIETLKKVNQSEYERVVETIANDLEAVNLVVEAARVRFQGLDIPYPTQFPMPEIAEVKGNLLAALSSILKHKF